MEIYFKGTALGDLYEGKGTDETKRCYPPDFSKQFIKAVKKIHSVTSVYKLNQFVSLQYQKHPGYGKNLGSILINKHYRLIFEEIITRTESVEIHLVSILETSKYHLAR
jgi:plasmid maintenance system killer protein